MKQFTRIFAALAMVAMVLTGCTKESEEPVEVAGVTLNKTTLALEVGASETLTATVAPDNAENKAVSWKSSDESVATVSGGAVTAKKAGTATITVTTTDGAKTATCAVTVTDKPAPPAPVITIGTQPTAPAGGLTEGSIPADTKLTVAATATQGATLKYQWYTYDPAASGDAAFTKIDGATAASYTLPTTLAAGDHWYVCEVSAEGAESKQTDPVKVTVTAATVAVTGVSLDKPTLALTEGETATLTATVAPGNASDKTVTWKSSDETVATVSGGTVTAKKAGTTTITVTSAADATKTATCAVTVSAPAYTTAPIGKWNVGANASGIVSVEFGVSGDYVVVVDEPLTRAEANYVAYYGTYTFTGNKATLSGFGSITIRSLAQDAIAFTLERENGGSVELNGEKAEEMASSTKTDLLCRTWKIVAYEDEDGYRENEPDPNDDGEWAQYVFFSKAGTYLVTYFGGETMLSNWKWKSEANGTLQYSHDFPPEWTEDSTVTITTLTNDKCVIDENGLLYYLELK